MASRSQPPDDLVASCTDFWGRTVTITASSLAHIAEGHPEIRPKDVQLAVQKADKRTRGNRPGTEVLWAKGRPGGAKWIRVVVAYGGPVGTVKTAFDSTKGPTGKLI